MLIDGRDVTDAIRTPEVSKAASQVAADPAVRAVLVAKQQEIMADGDWVAEGRDIATVVAPDAAVKVFLTADPNERARRRFQQRGGDIQQIRRDQDERDRPRRQRRPHRARAGARRRPGRHDRAVARRRGRSDRHPGV